MKKDFLATWAIDKSSYIDTSGFTYKIPNASKFYDECIKNKKGILKYLEKNLTTKITPKEPSENNHPKNNYIYHRIKEYKVPEEFINNFIDASINGTLINRQKPTREASKKHNDQKNLFDRLYQICEIWSSVRTKEITFVLNANPERFLSLASNDFDKNSCFSNKWTNRNKVSKLFFALLPNSMVIDIYKKDEHIGRMLGYNIASREYSYSNLYCNKYNDNDLVRNYFYEYILDSVNDYLNIDNNTENEGCNGSIWGDEIGVDSDEDGESFAALYINDDNKSYECNLLASKFNAIEYFRDVLKRKLIHIEGKN